MLDSLTPCSGKVPQCTTSDFQPSYTSCTGHIHREVNGGSGGGGRQAAEAGPTYGPQGRFQHTSESLFSPKWNRPAV